MSIGSSEERLVIALFLYLCDCFIGRVQLSRELGIGEGKLRRLLSELHSLGLLEKTRAGVRLTPKGSEDLERLLLGKGVTKVFLGNARELNSETSLVAVTRLKVDGKVRALELRDEAVRGGAKGAIIAVVEKGGLKLPPSGDDLCNFASELCREILRRTRGMEGNLVIAVFADELRGAITGFARLLESRYYAELSQRSITPGTSESA